jgi:hypothetical protein
MCSRSGKARPKREKELKSRRRSRVCWRKICTRTGRAAGWVAGQRGAARSAIRGGSLLVQPLPEGGRKRFAEWPGTAKSRQQKIPTGCDVLPKVCRDRQHSAVVSHSPPGSLASRSSRSALPISQPAPHVSSVKVYTAGCYEKPTPHRAYPLPRVFENETTPSPKNNEWNASTVH